MDQINHIIAEFTLCFVFCFFLEALDNIVYRKRSRLYRITHLAFSASATAGLIYLIIYYHIY